MLHKRRHSETAKVKIGTILEKGVVNRLKKRAMREGRAMSALIEEAILSYDTGDMLDREMRLKALNQFFSLRFAISDKAWKVVMEEDYYDQ